MSDYLYFLDSNESLLIILIKVIIHH